MRRLLLLLPFLFLAGAAAPPVTERSFAAYFDTFGLEGSFLLLDVQSGRYTASNLNRCRQGFLPASTFKIPNTLIGLETGAVRDTAEVFRWDGVVRDVEPWNHDMSFGRALRVSCLPCYQQLARRMGPATYDKWLPLLQFGRMVMTPATVDRFWLEGPSRITQFEQIDFLRRLQSGKLPVSARTLQLTTDMLVLARGKNWTLRGKTGWTRQEGRHNGWFVGWVEQQGRVYLFALNAQPKNNGPATDRFVRGRRVITERILQREFGLLK
ncbi:hypothetical protein LJY25_16385 [Hymenobacter sp. BT175]|uniref:penicillin-binding transpeptidase domain-containing protein n=1 Tax=Hymenobacter translucens TaxID=2886507 RepID=UPI001D0E7F7F|nr:penicillin-binding transpeptidase domain-containing protein [Hymenobacter translucens]MCC2548028.1 hypothetical protein [Hymenobacter translucens]